jgi:hypothetical protein
MICLSERISRIALIDDMKEVYVFHQIKRTHGDYIWKLAKKRLVKDEYVLVYESTEGLDQPFYNYVVAHDLKTDMFAYSEIGYEISHRGGKSNLTEEEKWDFTELSKWINKKILTQEEFYIRKEHAETTWQGKNLAAQMLEKARQIEEYNEIIKAISGMADKGRTMLEIADVIGLGDREALANDGFDIIIDEKEQRSEIHWSKENEKGTITFK